MQARAATLWDIMKMERSPVVRVVSVWRSIYKDHFSCTPLRRTGDVVVWCPCATLLLLVMRQPRATTRSVECAGDAYV